MNKTKPASKRRAGLDIDLNPRGGTTSVVLEKQAVAVRGSLPPQGFCRLTINLRQDLHKKIKHIAIQEDTTVGDLIARFIEQYRFSPSSTPWAVGR